MIIEEKLTASYILKVSRRKEYLDDIQCFISDMKPFNRLLKEDKISKLEYLEILNKRKEEVVN